jgi:putative SOS response-associated peptidase YedK
MPLRSCARRRTACANSRCALGHAVAGLRPEGPQFGLSVTNVRNVSSSHWRRWLGVESRCVVPFTSCSENETLPDGSKPPVWFALDETRPLGFFAGIWTRWSSVRKVKEGETTNDLFAFLTTEPNAIVAPIHPKAIPVILTRAEEIETWLTAPIGEASLQSDRGL